jgi:hypothetical protein
MAELGLPTSKVMQEHLQNLMSQGYMTAAELATCHVPEDPASLVPAGGGGYVVVCTMFYERGFVVPSHRFLRLLLQFYGLELQHLTPSRILHMAAFVTLCETYMGIESHFNLWNYFRVWLQQGSGMEVATLGSMDIFVRPVHGVDPNFHLPTSSHPNGWWKVWFFLRNNTDAPLPIFMSSCHVPRPNWGYGVAQKDLRKL